MFLLSVVYFPKWNLPVKFFMLLLLPIQDVITVFQISSGWGNLFGQLFSTTHKKQWSWAPDWPNKNIQYSWNPEGINHKLLLFCCCCLHSHVFHCERSAQFGSSVMSNILWPPMDCSMAGFLVHHQLPEFAQTYVHQVSGAIQPPHPLSCPSPPAFSLSQHQGLFHELVLHIRWPRYWSFRFSIGPSNEYSGLISFRMDWLDLLAVQGALKSSPTPQFKSINSSELSFLYGPTLTSIHDYGKNHSFD